MFAFRQDRRRNAADVELVIDALDITYTRPSRSTSRFGFLQGLASRCRVPSTESMARFKPARDGL